MPLPLYCEVYGCNKPRVADRWFCKEHSVSKRQQDERKSNEDYLDLDPAERLKKAMCEWLDSVEERIKKLEDG